MCFGKLVAYSKRETMIEYVVITERVRDASCKLGCNMRDVGRLIKYVTTRHEQFVEQFLVLEEFSY